MSNAAKKTLNNMNMIQDPINDLLNISAQTSQNPFAYKRLMKQILSSQHESGNALSKLVGIESVLGVDGLPLFEFMIPQIDRMITSEHFGNRNY